MAVAVAGHGLVDEADALPVEERAVAVVRVDDDEARPVEAEMALDQGQGALADRAEADHDDRSVDRPVDGPVGHASLLCAESPGRRMAPGLVMR